MKYIFGHFTAIHANKATRVTLFSQNHSPMDCSSKRKWKPLHFSLTVFLLIGTFLITSFTSQAQTWWNSGIKDHFKVSFDIAKGQFTIQAFAIDKGYFSHSTLATTKAVLSYTTGDDVYIPFYQFKYNPHWQDTPDNTGLVSVGPLGSAQGHATAQQVNSDLVIRLNLYNGIRDIKGIKIECDLMNSDGDDKQNENVATINYTVPKLTFKVNGYNYQEDKTAKIDWSIKWSSNADLVVPQSFTTAYDVAGNKIADLEKGLSEGSFFVNQNNAAKKYYLVYTTYAGNVTDTAFFIVPAFTHPTGVSALYNTTTQNVDVTWSIPRATGDSIQKYPFKLQRATKSDFSDAININLSGSENTKYNPDSISYTYSESPHASVYYRIARSVNQDWGWELGKSVSFSSAHAAVISSSNVTLTLDNLKLRAILKWQPSGIWTKGATFTITRINKTSGSSTPVLLNNEDYFNGEYIDSLIAPCNEYYYSLQVKPADNLGYVAEKPFQTINSVSPYTIGTIINMTASKGYFPDRVELSWNSQGVFDNYILKRKVYGSSDNFIQIANIPGSSTVSLQAEDAKGSPGVYYQYMVLGAVKCNDELKYSKDTLYAIGFRAPTGNIYGRVTYESGQSVQDVAVRLLNNDNSQLGQSIYLNGTDSSYLKLDSLHTPFEDSAFTIEAWIKPDDASPKNQVIFSRGGQYELGFNAAGQLYFSYNGKTVAGNYMNSNQSFIHVAGIHSRDSLAIMINDSVIAKIIAPYSTSNNVAAVYIGRNSPGNHFKGYIDEMSAWNIALNKEQIAKDYTRYLTGGEQGMAAYWRFDETIANQFYDVSHREEKYNQNDGIMSATFVKRAVVTPTDDQLSLKAYTDSAGNYLISGIPYTGTGVTYTVVPLFETHKFEPALVNRLISAGSSSFTVDFKDKSAFAVSGFVYYSNSTVPATDVQFKIDGLYAQESNGNIIGTDATGKFSFSVPIGTHTVQAMKNNHVFENDGKITDRFGNDLNYQNAISQRILHDSTTIRFIGRVAGGAIQESYPLGHSLSTNNLGKVLSITMTLPSGTKYDLYAGSAPDSTVIVDHLLPSGVTDPSKMHHSRVVYSANKIMIYPDSLTGEFEADLIPEKFIALDVQATGWPDMPKGQSLDFTNKFIKESTVYNHVDSSQSNSGTWNYTSYSDSVAYNASYQFIEREQPTVSIVQINNGTPISYLGDSLYELQLLTGQKESIPLVNAQSGVEKYIFGGHPVFTQGVTYQFKLKAFEEYPFYESVKVDGTKVVRQKDGNPVIDQVPTQDGDVTINNNIQSNASPDALSLDSTGVATYEFIADDPDIISGLKNFSATIRFGQGTDVSWKWFGADNKEADHMEAYVMGSHQTGTDFVTAGPDKMLMVLRDPPGSRSYSFAEKGSTLTRSTTYSTSVDSENDVDVIAHLGSKIITWEGFLVGTIQEAEVIADDGLGIHMESHNTSSNTKETTVTLTSRFQTSDDPLFVGAPGDVFVGYSTNITYGKSNNITFIRRDNLQSTDKTIFDPGSGSPYLIVERDGINFGEKFGTLFAFPQQHIETVLIPNLKRIRNTILLPPGTSAAVAQQAANTRKTGIYVSKLASDNDNFGKSNNDSVAFGNLAKTPTFNDGPSYTIYFPSSSDYRTDTIMTINQYINKWEQELEANEKEKINATLLQNYSFHAGSPIDYSVQNSQSMSKTDDFTTIVSGSAFENVGGEVLGMGVEVNVSASLGGSTGGSNENSSENTSTIGFQLAADGVGEYISVDAGKASDGGFTFRTKGGETECPYEGGSKTKYYQKGQLVLDQPTMQMDKPQVTVDRAVVNNVPATQSASFTLHLENVSEAEWSTAFVLDYGNTDSVKGAVIAVDGLSIANGRIIPVIYGQKVDKVLTITKGPDAMDYNNIPIILHSACQYDITGYQQLIADTVFVSAHFVPSCSNINVKSPTDQWVLNSESEVNPQGKRYLPITLDQFDESNSLFNHIELQYKSSTNSQWITAMNFYGDSAIYKAASGEKTFITNAQGINYDLEMDDASFNDQKYDIRGVAYCQLSPGNFINTPSNVISGIKDTYNPRLFGSPEPGNGILGVGDDIRLNFNEPIAAGLLTPSDFRVTAIRNGAQGDHSVSVELDGVSDYITTEFDKNLTDRNITAEMWVLPDNKENGTLFSQGNINESMELAFTADNHIAVTIGKKKIISASTLEYRQGSWAHAALVYNAADSTVSAFYNFKEVIHKVTVNSYNGVGPFEFGRSISKQGDFFAGKMHGVQIWTQNLSAIQLQINSLTRLSGAEDGLLGYYPLSEGKGTIVYDEAHSNNATLIGNWSTPAGKSLELDGTSYLKMATGVSPITSGMDYTIELWFKAKPGQTDAALTSNGKGDGTDPAPGDSKKLFFLGFENGLLTYVNNGFKVQADGSYLDNNWHHVAIAVNRTSATGQIFVDGILKKYFNTQALGEIAAAYTYLGARVWYNAVDPVTPHFDQYFKGEVDGFRIWNTYLNEAFIDANSNTRLKGDELGLMVYYPFEKYFDFQNNKEMGFTLSDMKLQDDPKVKIPDAVAVNAIESNDMAPIKDRGPVDNLNFDFVVNNDALIINMLEPKQAIDKTIVTFQAKNVQDMNGNSLVSPITWTAYIDQNPLKWSDDELNLSKDVYKPMQFETYIVNSGGSIQHFVLDNVPRWLTADITSGTVAPEGKQKITFTINDGLNVGAYDEVIYVRNDNGESQGLAINLKVNGKAPDWQVNPADFQYNMTIYGKIRIQNIFSDDNEDMVAAFIDGKCVGLVHNAYLKQKDLWYVFLTVYNNSASLTGNIEFRAWDASTGKIYQAIPSTSGIKFLSNAIIGTSDDPVIFDGQEMIFQNLELNKGWNWISFNLYSPNLSSVNTTLANGIWVPGDEVKNNDVGAFDQYSNSIEWKGSLTRSGGFNNTSLYMLNTVTAQKVNINGTRETIDTKQIPVKGNRWNYISYLPQVNMTVEEALADYTASDQDVIKSQTGFTMYSSRNGWVGNLTYLEPGKGYMLYRKVNTNTSFVYPTIGGSLNIERGSANAGNQFERLNYLQAPVANNFSYADNMTLMAGVEGFSLRSNDKMLVYAGSELRGEALQIENPFTKTGTFFFNIAGNEQVPLSFRIERMGQVVAQADSVVSYRSNSIRGTLEKPVMLQFGLTGIGVSVSPNPFRKQVFLKAVLTPGDHEVQMSVYDVSGHSIVVYAKESTSGKYYQKTWDGRNSNGWESTAGIYFIHLFIDKKTYVYKVIKL
ncbi:MAG: LamG-like jellyroll fold domain-containing protein [Ginsengibacter sp.]